VLALGQQQVQQQKIFLLRQHLRQSLLPGQVLYVLLVQVNLRRLCQQVR
jgi:hypothetical protein